MTNLNNKAALLNRENEVIGEVFDAPAKGFEIEIAGCFTVSGQAVNVRTYKISRSVKNMRKAELEQPVSKVGEYFTFHAVDDEQAVY